MPKPSAQEAPPRSGPRIGPPRIGFVSLGCPKALVDSERLISELKARGGLRDGASGYAGADLVVVNTCGFINESHR